MEEYLNETRTRASKLTLADDFIAPFFFFFFFFCIRGATVSGVIKVCSLRRESPGSRQNRGREEERERESKREGGRGG